jgi:hypothetical protein
MHFPTGAEKHIDPGKRALVYAFELILPFSDDPSGY